jgi:hypothetical protein
MLTHAEFALAAAAEGRLEGVGPCDVELPPDDDPRRRLPSPLDQVPARLLVHALGSML